MARDSPPLDKHVKGIALPIVEGHRKDTVIVPRLMQHAGNLVVAEFGEAPEASVIIEERCHTEHEGNQRKLDGPYHLVHGRRGIPPQEKEKDWKEEKDLGAIAEGEGKKRSRQHRDASYDREVERAQFTDQGGTE